jgi:hypothetical protein
MHKTTPHFTPQARRHTRIFDYDELIIQGWPGSPNNDFKNKPNKKGA